MAQVKITFIPCPLIHSHSMWLWLIRYLLCRGLVAKITASETLYSEIYVIIAHHKGKFDFDQSVYYKMFFLSPGRVNGSWCLVPHVFLKRFKFPLWYLLLSYFVLLTILFMKPNLIKMEEVFSWSHSSLSMKTCSYIVTLVVSVWKKYPRSWPMGGPFPVHIGGE